MIGDRLLESGVRRKRRQWPRCNGLEVLRGIDGGYPWRLTGRRDVYPVDPGMGALRTKKGGMEHAGQSYVVEIAALALQKARVFEPHDRSAELTRAHL